MSASRANGGDGDGGISSAGDGDRDNDASSVGLVAGGLVAGRVRSIGLVGSWLVANRLVAGGLLGVAGVSTSGLGAGGGGRDVGVLLIGAGGGALGGNLLSDGLDRVPGHGGDIGDADRGGRERDGRGRGGDGRGATRGRLAGAWLIGGGEGLDTAAQGGQIIEDAAEWDALTGGKDACSGLDAYGDEVGAGAVVVVLAAAEFGSGGVDALSGARGDGLGVLGALPRGALGLAGGDEAGERGGDGEEGHGGHDLGGNHLEGSVCWIKSVPFKRVKRGRLNGSSVKTVNETDGMERESRKRAKETLGVNSLYMLSPLPPTWGLSLYGLSVPEDDC